MPVRARETHTDLIARNRRISWALLAGELLVISALGAFVAVLLDTGWAGVAIGVSVALVVDLVAWAFAVRATISATRAHEVSTAEQPMLHDLVEGLCIATGVPKPKLYVVDDRAPNACAFGRSPERAGIAVTTGLLALLSRRELEGVLAHELSHIRNGDVLVETLAVTTVGVVAVFGDVFARTSFVADLDDDDSSAFLVAILTWTVTGVLAFAARLLAFGVSRQREELADASAAATVSPTGLRKALEKLEVDNTVVEHLSRSTAHLWFVPPLELGDRSRRARTNRLFETHPPIGERIATLRALEGLDPDARGPVDRDAVGQAVELTHLAPQPKPIEPADTAPQWAEPAYTPRFGTAPKFVRTPVGQPAGWYHVDDDTLRYWQGTLWTHLFASWDGTKWISDGAAAARVRTR